MGTKNYRAVTAGQSLGDAAIVTFNWTGNTIRPLAPVNLRASRNSAGDVVFEWTRRSRIGSGFRPGSDVPLAEEREYFLIEIYSGSTIKRSARVPLFRSEVPMWEIVRNDTSEQTITIAGDGSIDITTTIPGNTRYVMIVSKQILSFENSIFAFDADTRTPLSDYNPMPISVGCIPLSQPLDKETFIAAAFQRVDATSVPHVWSAAAPIEEAARTRLALKLEGETVRFYQDPTNFETDPIIGTQQLRFQENCRAYIFHKNDPTWTGVGPRDAAIGRPVIMRDAPSFFYSAADQTVDFGSTQSSIKIRVYQISQIVGNGAYAEATL